MDRTETYLETEEALHDGIVDALHRLAGNLWWSWQRDIRAIFRSLDPKLWRRVHHNPVAMLSRMSRDDVSRRVHDLEIQTRIHQAERRLQEYLAAGITWGSENAGALMARPVGYFSAEFGLHQSIPIYSGGLGVLAGDHLKSMSDLGVPVAGVGLLYHQGYVHQLIDAEGRQLDQLEPIEARELPMAPLVDPDGHPVAVEVELPGRTLRLRVWEVAVGRARLLLLDARDDANRPEDVGLTGQLYGGDQTTRIQQELLLGVGGHRALAAAGVHPSVLHLNEGNSAFALLERARHLVERQGLPPEEAYREVAMSSLFTTHTPVEAGHDRFTPELAAEHLEPLARGLGVEVDSLVALGRQAGDPDGPFLPTVLALNLCHYVNGVSALHGRVSRRMWHSQYPGRGRHEVPIGHITNGVHARTWLAGDMQELIGQHLGQRWLDSITRRTMWAEVEKIPDAELWEVHQVLKARLIHFVRRRLAERRTRLGLDEPERPPLDPEALTIGFARRFATYKRADLMLRRIDRLAALLGNPDRPVQLVFAGKAHPRDEAGKRLVQMIARLERDPRFAGRVVFLENYSMHVGMQMVQGVDAWLNTPRRPFEACGTSGQKGVLNGVLQISVLDGWWAEAYDGANGFAIGRGETHVDAEVQDERAAEAAFDTLEREVVPLYYERGRDGLPLGWIARIKRAMRTLGWRFNADRMVMDYVSRAYLPAAGGESAAMPRRP
jgi:starch phosphorylase